MKDEQDEEERKKAEEAAKAMEEEEEEEEEEEGEGDEDEEFDTEEVRGLQLYFWCSLYVVGLLPYPYIHEFMHKILFYLPLP